MAFRDKGLIRSLTQSFYKSTGTSSTESICLHCSCSLSLELFPHYTQTALWYSFRGGFDIGILDSSPQSSSQFHTIWSDTFILVGFKKSWQKEVAVTVGLRHAETKTYQSSLWVVLLRCPIHCRVVELFLHLWGNMYLSVSPLQQCYNSNAVYCSRNEHSYHDYSSYSTFILHVLSKPAVQFMLNWQTHQMSRIRQTLNVIVAFSHTVFCVYLQCIL